MKYWILYGQTYRNLMYIQQLTASRPVPSYNVWFQSQSHMLVNNLYKAEAEQGLTSHIVGHIEDGFLRVR